MDARIADEDGLARIARADEEGRVRSAATQQAIDEADFRAASDAAWEKHEKVKAVTKAAVAAQRKERPAAVAALRDENSVIETYATELLLRALKNTIRRRGMATWTACVFYWRPGLRSWRRTPAATPPSPSRTRARPAILRSACATARRAPRSCGREQQPGQPRAPEIWEESYMTTSSPKQKIRVRLWRRSDAQPTASLYKGEHIKLSVRSKLSA